MGIARLHELLSSFMRPQQPHKRAFAFVTRITNKRVEIRQAWTDIPMEQVKTMLFEGLRREYQPYIAFLGTNEFDSLDSLQAKLLQTCNIVERQLKTTT